MMRFALFATLALTAVTAQDPACAAKCSTDAQICAAACGTDTACLTNCAIRAQQCAIACSYPTAAPGPPTPRPTPPTPRPTPRPTSVPTPRPISEYIGDAGAGFLVGIGALVKEHIVHADCKQNVVLFDDQPNLRTTLRHPNLVGLAYENLLQQVQEDVKIICPNIPDASLKELFSPDFGTLLRVADPAQKSHFQDAWKTSWGCPSNLFSGIFNLPMFDSFDIANLPSSCNFKTWTDTGKCNFEVQYSTTVSLQATVSTCGAAKLPSFNLVCKGTGCRTFGAPCTLDSECSSGQACSKILDSDGKNVLSDNGRFPQHILEVLIDMGLLGQNDAKLSAMKLVDTAISSVADFMGFKPFSATKTFFKNYDFDLGFCGVTFDYSYINDFVSTTDTANPSSSNAGRSCGRVCEEYSGWPTYNYKRGWNNGTSCDTDATAPPANCPQFQPASWKSVNFKYLQQSDGAISKAAPAVPDVRVAIPATGATSFVATDCTGSAKAQLFPGLALEASVPAVTKLISNLSGKFLNEVMGIRDSGKTLNADQIAQNFLPWSPSFWSFMMKGAPKPDSRSILSNSATPATKLSSTVSKLPPCPLYLTYYDCAAWRNVVSSERLRALCFSENYALSDRCRDTLKYRCSSDSTNCYSPSNWQSFQEQVWPVDFAGMPSSASTKSMDSGSIGGEVVLDLLFQNAKTPLSSRAHVEVKKCPANGLVSVYLDCLGANAKEDACKHLLQDMIQDGSAGGCKADSDCPVTHRCENLAGFFTPFLIETRVRDFLPSNRQPTSTFDAGVASLRKLWGLKGTGNLCVSLTDSANFNSDFFERLLSKSGVTFTMGAGLINSWTAPVPPTASGSTPTSGSTVTSSASKLQACTGLAVGALAAVLWQ